MNKELVSAYEILSNVYKGKGYASIALDKASGEKGVNFKLITRLVYGVLERDIELEYYLSKLADKAPRSSVNIIVKIGIYALKYIDSMQNYAVVDSCVKLCDHINKAQLKGFVNAILNRYIKEQSSIELPLRPDERISIELSKPLWLVKSLIKQYGREQAVAIMSVRTDGREHVRHNSRLTTIGVIESLFKANRIEYARSPYDGYYIVNDKPLRELFSQGLVTIQSPSSMLVCKALGVSHASDIKILDLCAAPGGKSVYLSEINADAEIFACDLHTHRVDLISKYSTRMQADNINPLVIDGREVARIYGMNSFDYVLCDAPCSGLGVAHRKPDIMLNASMDKCNELAQLQYELLSSAIDVAKVGGYIVYSTCTMLREENMNVVGKMLKERDDIALEKLPLDIENNGTIQLLPTEGLDGFFIARLKKLK